jgi:hypothetical protein
MVYSLRQHKLVISIRASPSVTLLPLSSSNTLKPPEGRKTTNQSRAIRKYYTITIINMSHQQSGSGSGRSSSSPPGGSQTNWNDVLRYSSPIGVVKTDVVYGVYNTGKVEPICIPSGIPPKKYISDRCDENGETDASHIRCPFRVNKFD